jgi:hypothetical protein
MRTNLLRASGLRPELSPGTRVRRDTAPPAIGPQQGDGELQPLEEQIDDCLSLAKHLDREGLAHVIQLLRRARNEVVWKLGQ